MESKDLSLKVSPSNNNMQAPPNIGENPQFYSEANNENKNYQVVINNFFTKDNDINNDNNYNINYNINGNNNQNNNININYFSDEQNNVTYAKPSSITNNKIQQNIIVGYQFFHFDTYDLTSKFLMKVYGILFFQFLIIFGLVMLFQIKSITNYLENHGAFYAGILIVSIFVFILILIIFICCPTTLRNVPCNYIMLFVLTFFLGILCASIGSCYQFEAVLGAITCVFAICIGSFCVGLFDKGNGLKFYYIFLPSLLLLAIHYGIMAAIFRSYYLYFLYDSIIGIVYALYISFDILVIKETYSLDDYIFAAVILTLDIVRLFIFILEIFGKKSQ